MTDPRAGKTYYLRWKEWEELCFGNGLNPLGQYELSFDLGGGNFYTVVLIGNPPERRERGMKKKHGIISNQIDVDKEEANLAKALIDDMEAQGMFKQAEEKFIEKWTDHFVVMKRVGRLSRKNIKSWVRGLIKDFKETQI